MTRLSASTAIVVVSLGSVVVDASAAPAKGHLSILAGNGTAAKPTPGPARKSALDGPFHLALDGAGDVYIADTANNRVEKISRTGNLSVIAGTGAAGKPKPGRARRSRLYFPAGVAVDRAGDVYIADTGNHQVEKISPAGMLSIIAGTGTAGRASPGSARRSELSYPYGVAVDRRGDVYIADTFNHEVDKVSPAGTLSVLAGTGTAGRATPGRATRSPLDFPAGVAADGAGDVYIADTFNHQIDRISPAGTLSIVAGTGTPGPPSPGRATRSDLQAPYGVAVDGRGSVYIADTFNHEVEKVSPTGTLSIVAGTGISGRPTPGKATRSRLGRPTGVAVSVLGNVFIADDLDNEVVKVHH